MIIATFIWNFRTDLYPRWPLALVVLVLVLALLVVPLFLKRWRWRYAVAVSTFFALATVILWVADYNAQQHFGIGWIRALPAEFDSTYLSIQSAHGAWAIHIDTHNATVPITVREFGADYPSGDSWPLSLNRMSDPIFVGRILTIPLLTKHPPFDYQCLGFQLRADTFFFTSPSGMEIQATHGALVPSWFFLMIFLILPAWQITWPLRRTCRRAREGLCVKCGYNLHGLPEPVRCPECGTTQPPKAET